MILHFQMTLPLLREANEASGFFVFFWFSASVSSLSRGFFWKRGKLFSGVVSCSVLLWERRGGVVVRQTRQGKARQGRQFVIMIGSAVAFWPGGNVIPGIIALAFSCAGSLPYVCVCVCVCVVLAQASFYIRLKW